MLTRGGSGLLSGDSQPMDYETVLERKLMVIEGGPVVFQEDLFWLLRSVVLKF